jgi:hypothetical protein
MRYRTISQIGAFTALSSSVDDYLAIAPSRCSGGGDAPTRVTEEDAPGQDGSLILPVFDGPQIITLAGDMVVMSTGLSSETGYREAIDTLVASLKSALTALKAAPDDLVHAGGTLRVWKHGELDEAWDDFETICSVTFSVIVDVFA